MAAVSALDVVLVVLILVPFPCLAARVFASVMHGELGGILLGVLLALTVIAVVLEAPPELHHVELFAVIVGVVATPFLCRRCENAAKKHCNQDELEKDDS